MEFVKRGRNTLLSWAFFNCSFSWPNTVQVYQPKVNIAGEKTYPIMNFPLPEGVGLGQYKTCGVLVEVDTAPLEPNNWIHIDCAGFEVY
jgi:biotin-(acetyl-CoA carboxylase) ligase